MREGLANEVISIACDAGAAILAIYEDEQSWSVEKKSDNSPLTKADKTANDIIVAGLNALDIVYPIISEEQKLQPYTERQGFDKFWLVDPLDGTKEFIKRNGEFTVNIALVQAGRPVLGIVYVPVTDDIYWAAKGRGAFHVKGGQSTQLHAAQYKDVDQGLKIVCSRSHINTDTQSYIDQFDLAEAVSKGSSLKFMLLAEGSAHIYPRLGPTMEWDTGAAQIILEEAGGEVLHSETMMPLTYNKEDLLNPFFIARGNRQADQS